MDLMVIPLCCRKFRTFTYLFFVDLLVFEFWVLMSQGQPEGMWMREVLNFTEINSFYYSLSNLSHFTYKNKQTKKHYSFFHRDYVPFIVLIKVIFSMFLNRYLPPFHGHSATTLKIESSNFNCLIIFSDMRIRRVCFLHKYIYLKNR